EVYLRAGLDLRKPAAGRAAFHSEHRAERWFARSNHHFFADVHQTLREADGRNGLAHARSRGNARHDHDQLAAPLEGRIAKRLDLDLAVFGANLLEILVGDF